MVAIDIHVVCENGNLDRAVCNRNSRVVLRSWRVVDCHDAYRDCCNVASAVLVLHFIVKAVGAGKVRRRRIGHGIKTRRDLCNPVCGRGCYGRDCKGVAFVQVICQHLYCRRCRIFVHHSRVVFSKGRRILASTRVASAGACLVVSCIGARLEQQPTACSWPARAR